MFIENIKWRQCKTLPILYVFFHRVMIKLSFFHIHIKSVCEYFIQIKLQDCFIKNSIMGKKLILMDASKLPLLNITDFEHIKVSTINVEIGFEIRRV